MNNEVTWSARWCREALLIPFRQSTYRRIGYLLVSLPLGIAYAAFIVTGFALGFGLLPLVVGIPILSLTLTVTWRLVDRERHLAARVLGAPSIEQEPNNDAHDSWWSMLRARMVDRRTYWGAGILIAKLPVGIVDLIVSVLALAPTLAILGAIVTAPFNNNPTPFSHLALDGVPEIAIALALLPIAWLGALHLLVRVARCQARLTLRAYDARVPTTDRSISDQIGRPALSEPPPPDRFERLGT